MEFNIADICKTFGDTFPERKQQKYVLGLLLSKSTPGSYCGAPRVYWLSKMS